MLEHLEPEVRPVRARQCGAHQANENNEQDHAAAATAARAAASEAETILQKVENLVDEKYFEQSG